MKRRHRAIYNKDTKIQLVMVIINNVERKAIVIDHLRNMGFIADDGGDMNLSVGRFNSTPTKYSRIKKLIAGNFSENDSKIIDQAIIGANMKAPKTDKPPQSDENTDPTITAELDLEREIACYEKRFQSTKKIVEKIDNLRVAGIPKDYILRRYPADISNKMWKLDATLMEKKIKLHHALEKKSLLKEKIDKLTTQLQAAEYDEYLAREEYIVELQSCTDALADFDASINPLLEEDLAELDRLKRINELEEKLTALKSESKLFSVTASAPSTPVTVAEKPAEKPAKLEVELPTEQQDKEIRFLANHLYQVRRGNEEHNPTICRRIAALSAELKLTKAEFCKKILSISVQCWDDRHKRYFTDLGLHLHGERRPTTNSKKKDPNSNYKETVKKWADTHLISADGNDVLNSDVYDKFVRDTGFSDIAKISFYNVLARSLGYTHKCKYRRDSHGKTCCDTYYSGYQLV